MNAGGPWPVAGPQPAVGPQPRRGGEESRLRTMLEVLARLAGLKADAVLRRRIARLPPAVVAAADPGAAALENPGWAAVLDGVTVQETRLFRHPAQLLAIGDWLGAAAMASPMLLSAGCATGEEAWSLAALLLLLRRGEPAGRVCGIDICRPALALAEAAAYGPAPPDPLRDVPAVCRAMFPMEGGVVRPLAPLRAMVGFRRASLLELPPELPRLDLALCRNVLIYFTDAAREKVVTALVERLRPGGLLGLGATDSPPPGLALRPWGSPGLSLWEKR